jgi:hypothetical protein
MDKLAPLPTLKDLWEAQFLNHIVGMLTLDGQGWDIARAQNCAQMELDAVPEEERDGDPIECANDCMSAWDDTEGMAECFQADGEVNG